MRFGLATVFCLLGLVVAAPAWGAAPGLVAAYAIRRGLRARPRPTRPATGAPERSPARRGPPAATAAHSRSTAPTTTSGSRPRHLLQHGLHARGLGAEGNDEERRRHRRHVGRQRADALGRPSRDAATTSRSAAASPRTSTRGMSPLVGQWQHLAATFNGTTARFYVDGAEVASRTVSGAVGTSNTWRIGAYGSVAGGFFDGLIDEIRVYDRALSAAEIAGRHEPAARASRTRAHPPHPEISPSPGARRPRSRSAGPPRRTTPASPATTSIVDGASAGTTTATSFTVTGLPAPRATTRSRGVRRGRQHLARAPSVSGSTAACAATPGLVAAYAFDEGSGTAANDASGNGKNGAISGATWVTGRHGGALSFDGIDDNVALGSPRHLLQQRASRSRRGCGRRTTKKDVGGRRHLGRQRPDALDRPCRRPPLRDARQQLLLVSRLGPEPASSGSGSTWRPPSTATTARYYVDGAAGRLARRLRQRRQLGHLADRRLRRQPGRLLRRRDRRRPRLQPRLTPARSVRP